MLKRVFAIIENNEANNKLSSVYDYVMIGLIFLSLLPLGFKKQTEFLIWIDRITVCTFIIDYSLRWMTANLKFNNKKAFIFYPITPFAIIDLLSILPSMSVLSSSFKLFKLFRLFRTFRVFKLLRYSKNFIIIVNVLKREKNALVAVGTMAIAYILVSALAIFNIEPQTFDTFFDAIYWATISLTTVGYGDIYPISNAGRAIMMVSSFVGIAIVALPAGIMTAGYMSEVKREEG